MNAFVLLLERHPLVFFHLVTALGALGLGIVLMLRCRGTLLWKNMLGVMA